jgi:hypothetical protein
LLRGSGDHTKDAYDFGAIMRGNEDGGVPHGALLMRFAAAALEADPVGLAAERDRLHATLGTAATVDAAAVVGIFNAVVRVADATGIPLETYKADLSTGLRRELGIDAFRE